LNACRDAESGIPCARRLAAGALPHARGPPGGQSCAYRPHSARTKHSHEHRHHRQAPAINDSGNVPSTARPKGDGVRTLGVRRKIPRRVTSALTHARATVKLRASITIAAQGTSHHGARQALCTVQPRRMIPAGQKEDRQRNKHADKLTQKQWVTAAIGERGSQAFQRVEFENDVTQPSASGDSR